jgi:hypothetical protein
MAALTPYERDIQTITGLKQKIAQMDAEGVKEDDRRRLALSGDLLRIQASKDMKAASLANAPSPIEKNLKIADTLANNDPRVKNYLKAQQNTAPGTEEYNFYDKKIDEIRNSYVTKYAGEQYANVPSAIEYPKPKEEPGFIQKHLPEFLGGTPSAAAAPSQDGTVNIPGKGTFKQLPNGNYVKVG